ncbi:MAG: tetratricopeptide repeat protein [Candidatus Omnitrophica bacterium]|nr:tetratricopeptide repeat protein [Candidatus Omnitrophota bacterium]
MKFKYLNSVICFCLTLGLSVLSAQAQDTYKTDWDGLAANSQDYRGDTESLSHFILGAYYEGLGDFAGAAREYRKSLEIDPQSSLLHLSLASVFFQKDNPGQAIEELKHSVALDPGAVQPHAFLALIYTAQGKPDLAAEEYAFALENASKSEPENGDIYKGLGVIYLQQKKFKQAEGIFKLVINMAPEDPAAYYYLGNVYYALEDYPSAEKELKNAIKLKPDYHEALNFLGYFYLEQDKNIDQAGQMIKQALDVEPENGAYLDSLGWFYYKKENFQEALNYLEKAASFLSDPVIYEHLGDVFLKLGNLDNVKLNWEKSLKLNPQQDTVKAKLLKLTNHGK